MNTKFSLSTNCIGNHTMTHPVSVYEHKFQSLIGNYNSPYISNPNSLLFSWFHDHTHILIIQESEIRIVKKRI